VEVDNLESNTAGVPSEDITVVAIISAYNEGDIIARVIQHLVENEIIVYLIDNRSTDDTVAQASPWLGKGLINIEQFPPESESQGQTTQHFAWSDLLRRKEQLSLQLKADWFIHHDADELREAPWVGCSLKDGIRWADNLGYNCIDFRVLNFPPVNEGFLQGMDPAAHFRCYQGGGWFDLFQRKCWKNGLGPVSLALGGHDVQFEGRRVFPVRFLLRHYPIRSQMHGVKKVFAERKPRYLASERARGWHQQYDRITAENHSFTVDDARLKTFNPHQTRLELFAPGDGREKLDLEPLRRQAEEVRALSSQPGADPVVVQVRVKELLANMDKMTERVAALRASGAKWEEFYGILQSVWRGMRPGAGRPGDKPGFEACLPVGLG
jgi:hypothetical protein